MLIGIVMAKGEDLKSYQPCCDCLDDREWLTVLAAHGTKITFFHKISLRHAKYTVKKC